MKLFYMLLTALCTFQWADAQNVTFPDSNFQSALLNYIPVIDTNNDGEISIAEAEAVTLLSVSSKSISDLTGIEYFTNLKNLDCSFNSLTNLDVRSLTNLEYLYCLDNSLTRLDVSGLTSLKTLNCAKNSLASLDVRGLTSLEELWCLDNSLTSLDVSGLTSLVFLACFYNDLTSLDIRNTGALFKVYAYANPNLECIVVDDVNSVPDEVLFDQSPIPYTTEPCLILDFDDLADVIDEASISPYLATVLVGTARLAEESCSLGNKSSAIYTLQSLKLMVHRSRQIGRMTASQASELIESIDMLIDNIRSGAVDCNGGRQKNILDWMNDWFGWNSLEEPAQASTLDTYSPSSAVQNVYPNPTSGRVYFAQPDQHVVVYDMLGKVMEKAVGVDHIDLSTYQPGVYVIQLMKGEERSIHQVVKR